MRQPSHIQVRPPKKSWKNIVNLSGGEKTLSSLALVFALHHYKPTPLYVMDEIDAALDFRNVSIVGNYIKERTRNAQVPLLASHTLTSIILSSILHFFPEFVHPLRYSKRNRSVSMCVLSAHQFIIISLRNNMFELADRLVGIYKTNDCTNSIAIDPHAFTIAAR